MNAARRPESIQSGDRQTSRASKDIPHRAPRW